ncbi:MAG: GGDEF domain-containing protein [Lachnospiraceae bacterium]
MHTLSRKASQLLLYCRKEAYQLSVKIKVKHLMMFLSIIHFLLLLFFIYAKAPLMVWVNVISVMLYLFFSFQNIKYNYKLIIIIVCSEVLIHMALATLSVGWSSGFYLYVLLLIPTIYYLSYIAESSYRQYTDVFRYSFIAFATFIILRVVTYVKPPLYPHISPFVTQLMYLFNACLTIGVLILFMTIFLSTIQQTEASLKAQNGKLSSLANLDPLTGFYNRRCMNEFLVQAVEDAVDECSEFGLIMGDIDDFKSINDTYGHECGDLVLKKIAHIMQHNIRETDFICRWGGEEILLLLHNCTYENTIRAAENIRKKIAEASLSYGDATIHFSMTFGVHRYESNNLPSELVRKADHKLYQGKVNGKNCVVSE